MANDKQNKKIIKRQDRKAEPHTAGQSIRANDDHHWRQATEPTKEALDREGGAACYQPERRGPAATRVQFARRGELTMTVLNKPGVPLPIPPDHPFGRPCIIIGGRRPGPSKKPPVEKEESATDQAAPPESDSHDEEN